MRPTPAPGSTWPPSAPCRSPGPSVLADPLVSPSNEPPRHRASGGRGEDSTASRPAVIAGLLAALVAGIAAAVVLSGLAGLVSPDGSRDGAPGAALASGVAAASDRDPADAEREAATAGFLRELGVAFERGGARAARAPAGPLAARRLAAAVARNVARLDVDGLDLRRVAEAPATADLVSRFGAATWVAEVEVVWRYAGIDRRSVSSTVELVLTPGEDGATLDDIRPAFGEQAPTWLLEPLTVRRRDRVSVAASDPTTASRLLAQAARAVTVVDRRLPAWRGDLVVEAPASVAGFRAASGLTPAAARSIAAVTTTADGATLPGSPERVFVNPEVFEPLGAAGQQIVIKIGRA